MRKHKEVKRMYCYFCMKEIKADGKICPHCGKSQNIITPPHRLLPGTMLNGRYVVGIAKGEGGFGITYIGRDNKLDRLVAIKEYYPTGYVNRSNTISPAVTEVTSEESSAFFRKGCDRFLKEAKTIAKFSGEPGIVNVIDYFEENNTAYIVMEYLDGITLKDYLTKKGKLSAEETLSILRPVMLSLEKIHQQGLIHRDISPSNIMLIEDAVKLIDFGAARNTSGSGNKSLSLMLKPGYAPEEQYRSKGLQGAWTDVYALCATIYKCITGVTPDEANDRLFADELKAPSALGINVTPTFEAALMKGLAVHQKDRYQSIKELLEGFHGGTAAIKTNSDEEITMLSSPQITQEEIATQYIPAENVQETETPYIPAQTEDAKETCYQPEPVTEEHRTQTQQPYPSKTAEVPANKGTVGTVPTPAVKPIIPPVSPQTAPRPSVAEVKTDVPVKKRSKKKPLIIVAAVVAALVGIGVIVGITASNHQTTSVQTSSSSVLKTSSVVSTTSKVKSGFDNEEVTKSDIEELVGISSITRITMYNCTVEQDAIDALAKLKGQIASLTLKGCTGFHDYSTISKLSGLQHLAIESSQISDSELKSIDFSQFKSLWELTLSNNTALTDISPIQPVSSTLSQLKINSCPISDISVLSGFSKLSDINASQCSITDITALSSVPVQDLNLSDNKVKDITPLSQTSSLYRLNLDNNEVTSLAPLSSHADMRELSVNKNKLKDLNGLEMMLRLKTLSASGNEITTIDGIINCTILENVDLSFNKITDISLLGKSRKTLQKVFIHNNTIEDISCFDGAEKLTDLSFANNKIEKIDALKTCTQLQNLLGIYNQIQSIKALSDLDKLQYIYLSHNKISDMSPVSSLSQQITLLDLGSNNISQLSLPASFKCKYLAIYNNPLKSINGIEKATGSALLFSYIDQNNLSGLSKHFNKIMIVDCPLDQRVAIEQAIGKSYVTFSTLEEAENYIYSNLS